MERKRRGKLEKERREEGETCLYLLQVRQDAPQVQRLVDTQSSGPLSKSNELKEHTLFDNSYLTGSV